MSERNIVFLVAIAAFAAMAFLTLTSTDISSAGNDEPTEVPLGDSACECHDIVLADEPVAQKQKQAAETNIKDCAPQAVSMSPASFNPGVQSGPGIQAGDAGRHVNMYPNIRTQARDNVPVPEFEDIYDSVKKLIGEATVVEIATEDGEDTETVDLSQVDPSTVDEDFLLNLADALDDSSPEISEMIRSILELRSNLLYTSILWAFVCESSSSERKNDSPDAEEEAEENDPAVLDDGEDADEGVHIGTPDDAPYASYGTVCVAIAADYAAECCHGASDGPVL